MKKCSQCSYWVKMQHIVGICDLHDYGWVPSDKKGCKDFTPKKYKRPSKQDIQKIIHTTQEV